MKKDRKARKDLLDLYYYLEHYGYNECDVEDDDIEYFNELDKKFSAKYNNGKTCVEHYEYYGLFHKGDNWFVDPKRFSKVKYLPADALRDMAKRTTTFYHPRKKFYFDYKVNVFVTEVNEIVADYHKTYKKLIDKSINIIKKMKEVHPSDYYNFQCGISGIGAANAYAAITNSINKAELRKKQIELKNSLYEQFFHSMTSRIEACTIRVFRSLHPNMDKWNRKIMYDNTNLKGISSRNLPSFKFHNELYNIWNFIKHNNISTYKKLLESNPEVLYDYEYNDGDLAIGYLKLDEKLILEILAGVKEYFIEWCELNLNENYERAQWDYEDYFKSIIDSDIDDIVDPLKIPYYDDGD